MPSHVTLRDKMTMLARFLISRRCLNIGFSSETNGKLGKMRVYSSRAASSVAVSVDLITRRLHRYVPEEGKRLVYARGAAYFSGTEVWHQHVRTRKAATYAAVRIYHVVVNP